jgi:hypothetical protein
MYTYHVVLQQFLRYASGVGPRYLHPGSSRRDRHGHGKTYVQQGVQRIEENS